MKKECTCETALSGNSSDSENELVFVLVSELWTTVLALLDDGDGGNVALLVAAFFARLS